MEFFLRDKQIKEKRMKYREKQKEKGRRNEKTGNNDIEYINILEMHYWIF
jgi:restriction endonuclease Mrr